MNYDLKTGKIFDLSIHSGEENDLKDAKKPVIIMDK
jgi:hypothetical protein